VSEPEAPAKKRSGPAPSEAARRDKGDYRGTLRLPKGRDADAVRELVKDHGGLAAAVRWLLRQAGL
jgi:hypothetical protein